MIFFNRSEQESKERFDWGDEGYYDDGGGGDIMDEDKNILNQVLKKKSMTKRSDSPTIRPLHRRHLHKHPYDRGPNSRTPSTA